MSKRAAVVVGAGLAVVAVACGHPDQRVVDQYFGALRQGDTQTLTSFARVQFDQKVDDWKIVASQTESPAPAPLPELLKKVQTLTADLDANKRASQEYANEDNGRRFLQIQEVQEAQRKNAKIGGALAPVAEKWAEFNEKDRSIKKQLADARSAVEEEKRNVMLSIGQQSDLEGMTGQMSSKDLDLELTIAGQAKPYTMTLRKYDMEGGTGPRLVSRWFIYALKPKG
jgi:hypothetical protein